MACLLPSSLLWVPHKGSSEPKDAGVWWHGPPPPPPAPQPAALRGGRVCCAAFLQRWGLCLTETLPLLGRLGKRCPSTNHWRVWRTHQVPGTLASPVAAASTHLGIPKAQDIRPLTTPLPTGSRLPAHSRGRDALEWVLPPVLPRSKAGNTAWLS